MATEQGLYAQVVKLNQKDLKIFAENKNKNEAKFNFQVQSAICWFNPDFDWIKVNFSTRKTDLYIKPFHIHEDT